MKKALWFALGLAVSGGVILAAAKSNVSQVVVQAQFVTVETINGPVDLLGPSVNVPREDRAAVAAVEEGLRQWGRYKLTLNPENADLIIVVRKGRLVSAGPRFPIGRRPTETPGQPGGLGGPATGVGVGVDAGSRSDTFAVYLQSLGGPSSAPQWIKAQDHGLEKPDVPLLKMFREDVENAAKQAQKKKK